MEEHIWKPVEADMEGLTAQIVYKNELDEEYVHAIDAFFENGNPRARCWNRCSGDWPGCRMTCPAFAQVAEQIRAEVREWEKMPPYDPFNFMLNRTESIDDQNFYVEEFDTLDGAHWAIALDIRQRLQDLLDLEAEE